MIDSPQTMSHLDLNKNLEITENGFYGSISNIFSQFIRWLFYHLKFPMPFFYLTRSSQILRFLFLECMLCCKSEEQNYSSYLIQQIPPIANAQILGRGEVISCQIHILPPSNSRAPLHPKKQPKRLRKIISC